MIANREQGVKLDDKTLTTKPLSPEMRTMSMDDARFMLLKATATELLVLSSGTKYQCASTTVP